jgi:hypothetical protein
MKEQVDNAVNKKIDKNLAMIVSGIKADKFYIKKIIC